MSNTTSSTTNAGLKKGKKTVDPSLEDNDEFKKQKREEKRIQLEEAEKQKKEEMGKLLQQIKSQQKPDGILQLEKWLQVPVSPGNILETIAIWDKKGYTLINSVQFMHQCYMIFQKK